MNQLNKNRAKLTEGAIKQVERDINILKSIIDGDMENYTKHPIPVLKEALIEYQDRLRKLQENVGQ